MALLPEKEMDQLDCPFTDWINKEARKKNLNIKSQHLNNEFFDSCRKVRLAGLVR